jgi:hypothetical protein
LAPAPIVECLQLIGQESNHQRLKVYRGEVDADVVPAWEIVPAGRRDASM